MRKLWLKKDEDRRLRAGHLWVFSNEVDMQKSPLTDFAPGEEATLCDVRGNVLGSACLNPASLICARLYARKGEQPLDADLLRQRLGAALALRERLYAGPWYRLCHGEGDFLPGLVIDRYGDHLTVQISTAGMEARRALIETCLDELLAPATLFWDNDLAARGLEGLPRGPQSRGALPERLLVPGKRLPFSGALAPRARKPAGFTISASTGGKLHVMPGARTCWISFAMRAGSGSQPRLPGPDPSPFWTPRLRRWPWRVKMPRPMRRIAPLRASAATPFTSSTSFTRKVAAFP